MDSVAADFATWWPMDMVRRYFLELIKLLLTFINPVIDAWIFTLGIYPSIHSPYCVMGHFFNCLKPNRYYQSSQLPNKNFWRKGCQQGWESSSFVFSGIFLNPCKIRCFFFAMGPGTSFTDGTWKDLTSWEVEDFLCSSQICKMTKDLGRLLSSKWFLWDKGILPLWSQFSFCNKRPIIPKNCTESLVSWDSIWNTGHKKKPGSPRFLFLTGREETPMSTSQKPQNWVDCWAGLEKNQFLGPWKSFSSGATINHLFRWKQILVWDGDAEMHRYIGVHSIHRKNHLRPIHYLGWLVVRT